MNQCTTHGTPCSYRLAKQTAQQAGIRPHLVTRQHQCSLSSRVRPHRQSNLQDLADLPSSQAYQRSRLATLHRAMRVPKTATGDHSRSSTCKCRRDHMSTLSCLPDEQVVQIIHDQGARLALALLLGTTHRLVCCSICRTAVAASTPLPAAPRSEHASRLTSCACTPCRKLISEASIQATKAVFES